MEPKIINYSAAPKHFRQKEIHLWLRVILFLWFCFISELSMGQQTIKGTVKAADGSALPFATVGLLSIPDSAIQKGEQADAEGKFQLSLPKKSGNFILQAKTVGYVAGYSPVLRLQEGVPSFSSYEFTLEEEAFVAAGVEIEKKKPIIKAEAGKVTVSVENSAISTGTDALTVLKRMPGVVVDNDGNVSFRGKQGVLLMLDGRPTFLTPNQFANLLRSIPSSQVKEIELITQPDARYDAQGTAGIININLKRNEQEGITGQVNASFAQGVFPKSDAGANLTFQKGKWGSFLSYAFSDNNRFMDIINNRTYPFNNPNTGVVLDETRNLSTVYVIGTQSHNYRGGASFQGEKTNIRIEGSGRTANALWQANSTSDYLNAQQQLINRTLTEDFNPDRFSDVSAVLSLKHKFDTAGRHLFTADVDFGQYQQISSQRFRTWLTDQATGERSFAERYMETDPLNRVLALKSDYHIKFGKGFELVTGLKLTDVLVGTNNRFFNIINGAQVVDTFSTSTFNYTEQIRAGFKQLKWANDHWNITGGIRVEHWRADGKVPQQNRSFVRDQLFVLPSLSVTYNLPEGRTASLMYSQRINRPVYGNLNPYTFQVDNFMLFTGNTDLLPEIAHNVELGYTLFEGAMGFSVAYGQQYNNIVNYNPVRLSDTARLMYIKPFNIPLFRNIAVNAYGTVEPFQWWQLEYFGSIFFNRFEGDILGGNFSNQAITPMAQATNTFRLGLGWEAEMQGNIMGLSAGGLSLTQPLGQLTLGLKKKFLNDALTFRMAAQDIFYTDQYNSTISSRWMNYDGRFRQDSRMLTVALTYNFGKTSIKAIEKRSVDEDLQRMGGR